MNPFFHSRTRSPSRRPPRLATVGAVPLLLAATLLCSETTQGSVQLTTLGNPIAGPGLIGAGNAFGYTFVVGNQDYALNSVTAELFAISEGDFSLQAVLYNGSTTPGPTFQMPVGAPITTFTFGSIGPAYGDVVFTPDNPVSLSANGTYVFVLMAESPLPDPVGGSWGWGLGLSSNGYGPLGTDWEASFLLPFSADNVTWSAFAGGTMDYVFNASIDATAVPEPSAFLLVAGGALTFWRLRRRK